MDIPFFETFKSQAPNLRRALPSYGQAGFQRYRTHNRIKTAAAWARPSCSPQLNCCRREFHIYFPPRQTQLCRHRPWACHRPASTRICKRFYLDRGCGGFRGVHHRSRQTCAASGFIVQ